MISQVGVMVLALHSMELSQTAETATSTAAMSEQDRQAIALEKLAQAAERMAAAAEKMAGVQTPAKPAEEKKDEVNWAGTVGFGLIWLAGNSETLTFSGNAAVEIKLPDWILSAKANGAYGETLIAGMMGEPQVVAMQAGVLVRADRRFTEKVTGYAAGALETDHVKSVDMRATAEGGSGILWIEDKKEDFVVTALRTDIAFRYTKEERFQFYPVEMELDDVKLIAPRLGIAFRHAPSESIIFTEDAEVLPNIVGDSRVLLNSISKLSVRLTKLLSFGVALGINHDTRPALGKEKTDSALTVGLELAL
jgi:hypothetical protein